jgi:hypothetical protein
MWITAKLVVRAPNNINFNPLIDFVVIVIFLMIMGLNVLLALFSRGVLLSSDRRNRS